ncbi:MAG: FGGY-family carbohydrate kinase [Pirellulales bacterium]|nr:FGGY-family carbohydrate kinase [Pirellulales bacterium]
MNQYLLGIDVGTTNVKAALFDSEGRTVAENTCEHATLHPRPGWAEQDSVTWWDGTVKVLGPILSSGIDASEIKGVGISCQAPALVPLDDSGVPLRNALIWMDTRSAPQCERIRSTLGEERVQAITGNRIDPSYLLSKTIWLKENEPELFARTRRILTANGYIVYHLTGRHSCDISHASLSQLYDVKQHAWSQTLCDTFGIPLELFPQVFETSDVVGTITREAAAATGLPEGVPVVAGIVDANAAGLSAGVVGSGDGVIVMGTSSVLLMGSDKWIDCGNLAEIYHATPGSSVVFAAMSTTGASLKWFRDQFGQVEQSIAEERGQNVYDILTAAAAEVEPGVGNLIFLPYMNGERAPIWDSSAQGTLFGLSLKTTRAQVIRAILVGVAFGLYQNVREAQNIGLGLSRLMAVGGGNSEHWFRIIASVLGIPICLPGNNSGATFGAAVLAGVGTGVFKGVREIVDQAVTVAKTIEPEPAWHAHYQELFEIYCNLYHHLKDDMHNLAALDRHPDGS